MLVDYKSKSKKTASLSREISELIGAVKKEEKKRFSFWYKAVGEKISKSAVPVMVRKNVLIVRVEDSVWRFELARRKNELLEAANSHLKEEKKLKDIVFK